MAFCSQCNANVGCACNLQGGKCAACREKEEALKQQIIKTQTNVPNPNQGR